MCLNKQYFNSNLLPVACGVVQGFILGPIIIIIIIIIIIMYANLYSAITLQKNYKGALHENCHRL